MPTPTPVKDDVSGWKSKAVVDARMRLGSKEWYSFQYLVAAGTVANQDRAAQLIAWVQKHPEEGETKFGASGQQVRFRSDSERKEYIRKAEQRKLLANSSPRGSKR